MKPGTMDRRAIPDDEQLAMDLAQQHAQETYDVLRVVGQLLCLHKQASGVIPLMAARWSWVSGVWPWGAQVRTAMGNR